MSEENRDSGRFSSIREFGGDVADMARAVTGQSAREKIEDFTSAFTDAVTGLDDDVRSLRHRVGRFESEKQEIRQPDQSEAVAELSRSIRKLQIAVAVVGLVAIAAVVMALIT